MTTTRGRTLPLNGLACVRGLIVALSVVLAAAPTGAQAQGAGSATAGPAKGANDGVMLNFVNAELEAAVRAVGQYTGRQFVIDPRVRGTLTLVTERPVTKQQAYEQLLAALRLQGFTIVEPARADGIARIVPEADAKLQGGPVVVPSAAPPRGDQVVTQVFRLRFESATNLVPVLRPLIAPNNTISAYPANNSLVITDYAENLRRIGRIIEAIDAPAAAESEIVPLKHGLAVDIATIVNRAIEEGARSAGQATDGGQRVLVMAEPRTNSLILRAASPSRLALAKHLIERLDQPSLTPGNINVVYLRNAEAVKLAPLLRAVLSSDPSFVPQAGGPALSGTTISGGQQQPGQLGQPLQQPAAPLQSPAGTGGTGTSSALAGMIQPDAATNSLIITAPEPLYRNIRAIIEKLDARRAQVVIESLIVEVSADKAAEFGIQWQDLSGLNSTNTRVIGGTNFGGAGTNIIGAAGDLTSVGRGLNIGVIRGKVNIPGIGEITNLGFLARALETQADANVLSQPNIQTLDNEEAKFLVGQNIPFVTGSFTQTGTGATNPFQTFERKDIGLQLRVKPQISEGGVVRLALYLEVSSVAPSLSVASGQFVTNKRSFESVVLVEDGNFVVLSGLIEDRSTVSQEKVPLLGDLPLIGNFFRYENRDRRRTNTMVFLRPIIVRDEGTSTALAAERYDYMRAQIAAAQAADTLIFRDLNVAPLPPAPEARSERREAPPTPEAAPPVTPPAAPGAAATPATPAAAGPPGVGAAAPAAKPAGTVHLLQVAAVADPSGARRVQQDLRRAGFDAYWESLRTSTGEIVRVRVVVDEARRSLAETVSELKRLGYNPVAVPK